ncbi:MAG: serine O-acetyltransferase [Elusimicrobiota bacterium]|jgi:serine O-acetyltransferase|nr:serine O-acetyltransferase [Elusimicrobiota bacterium]
MFKTFNDDIKTIFQKDPAVRSVLEIIFCYPGFHAVLLYRFAHRLWKSHFYFLARFTSHVSRFLTGIEIHPAAQLGKRLFIDHGMGVVIGETAIVGDDVLIYKGVLLGGSSLEKKKRHPTVGNNVVLGSNAIVLGAITIGDNARIAAASVVTKDIPANATAIGVPARISFGREDQEGLKPASRLEHSNLPDPFSDTIKYFYEEYKKLEEKLDQAIESIEKKK